VKAKLDGVDLNQIEVETKDGGDEEEDDVADQTKEESGSSYHMLIEVVGPFVLKEVERSEDDRGDQKSKDCYADEAPEEEQALVEQRAEACRSIRLVAEKSSWYEQKVNEEVERD
jgi:hypothetical protein